jgi:hypothetical protein
MRKLSEDLETTKNDFNIKKAKELFYSKIVSCLELIFQNSDKILRAIFYKKIQNFNIYERNFFDPYTKKQKNTLSKFFIQNEDFDMRYKFLYPTDSYGDYIGDVECGENRVRFKASAIEIAKICLICLQENQFHDYVSGIINILNKMEEGHFFEIKDKEIFYKSLNNVEILEDKRINQDLKVMELKNRFYNINSTYQEKINVILNMQRVYLKDETLSKLLGISYVKDLILAFNNFCNKPEVEGSNHSGEGKKATKKATEEELQIMFDFGLTLIRLAKANNLI